MDQVASGPDGGLEPLDFDLDLDGTVSETERGAIRGRNTWLLWGGGNEAFWGWLQEQGYGLTDFLVLMDSRERGHRFRDKGLINEPDFQENTDPDRRVLGLWLDTQTQEKGKANPICNGWGEPTSDWLQEERRGKGGFAPYDAREVARVRCQLGFDGRRPGVYGYPSGIFGLRLWLNPDFFAKTVAAKQARERWQARVQSSHDAFYINPDVHADPDLVRPFRVSMACGFCHVGPHPLNPPVDPEKPGWANLSSTIGNQYWRPQPAFGALLKPDNFLYHFLTSQAPGTIDTSLISTDQINNANTIPAIFDVPARLSRAADNAAEDQSVVNRLLPSVEEDNSAVNPRHTPRVLLDGSDSVGVFGALIRVPVNIGTYSELWLRSDNPILGFSDQKPFSIASAQKNSVYWQTNELYRVPYMTQFFTTVNPHKGRPRIDGTPEGQSSTGAMKLGDTSAGSAIITAQAERAWRGRAVFVDHCAVCHSSKQPAGFAVGFTRDMPSGWDAAPAPAEGSASYRLPMDFAYWETYKRSPSYLHYRAKIRDLANQGLTGGVLAAGQSDPFVTGNFLASEIRIPVTLVGTNSGRAAATNAMAGQVWDNFSSDTYKALPSVGSVRYFDPFSGETPDDYGNNASYTMAAGGPGYYRPASLISLWATAPYLHNNTLGVLNPVRDDAPSAQGGGAFPNPTLVESRLAAFDDGIAKLLWKTRRPEQGKVRSFAPSIGDLRPRRTPAAQVDPGFIYRLPQEAWFTFKAPFISRLIEGVAGPLLTSILKCWIWAALTVLLSIAAIIARARHLGVLLVITALLLLGLMLLGLLGPPDGASLASALGSLARALDLTHWHHWLLLALLLGAGTLLLWIGNIGDSLAKLSFVSLALLSLLFGVQVHRFIDGQAGDLRLGPIPEGTPVNLLMNIDPTKHAQLPKALTALAAGMMRVTRERLVGDAAYQAFIKEAGPALLQASKCPDFVLDRGHWFGEKLSDDEKVALMAFLRTL